jgi:hypothetical protein
MPGRDAVQLLVDRDAVHDVMFRYADGVDRRDMERVRACFAPDLKVVGWGGGFADRDAMITYISGVAIFHTTMHMFGNDYIDVDGDTAHIDCYAMLTHHLDGANGDTSEMNVSGGRYVESLTRRDGQWVITQRGGDPHWSSRGVIDVITDDPATQWLLDRAEIHDLMMEYALGIDLRDYDRVGRCFASSFRAQYGDREFTDLDELVAFVSGVEHFASTTHFLGSQLIEVDGAEAWMQTYSIVTHRPDDGDQSGHWFAAGRYVDHLVREDGRWRIADRGPSAHDRRPERRAAPRSDDARVQRLVDRAFIQDAIVDSALAVDAENGATRHLLNNQLIEVDGDDATAQSYVYVTEQGANGRPSPWSQGARRWRDRWQRVDTGWRLVDRADETTRVPGELMISADEAAARARQRSATRN